MKEKTLLEAESHGNSIPRLTDNDCKGIPQESIIVESDYLIAIEQGNSRASQPTHGLIEDELRFLRPKEVAAILGVSRQMLWRMRKAGKFIKPVKITDYCVGFRSDELLCWMNDRQLVDNHE